MAEKEGFEPSIRRTVYRISSMACHPCAYSKSLSRIADCVCIQCLQGSDCMCLVKKLPATYFARSTACW